MPETPQQVDIVGIRMPFLDMVFFMVKWAIACIPAALILSLVGLGLVFAAAAMWGILAAFITGS